MKECPVYLISLARAEDRRAHMIKQFSELGVDFELVEAVDGKKLTPDQRAMYSARAARRVNERELSTGEIACALSHCKVYRKMLREGVEEALIVEDDACLKPELFEVVHHRQALPGDWELINFFTAVRGVPTGMRLLGRYDICKPVQPSNYLVAYLLNAAGAEKLVNHALPIRLPSDGLTGRTAMTGLSLYILSSHLASIADLPSIVWQEDKMRDCKRPFSWHLKTRIKKLMPKMSR